MGDTFARVQYSSIIEFYHNFAQLIYELEMLMKDSDRQGMMYFPNYMFFSRAATSTVSQSGGASNDT